MYDQVICQENPTTPEHTAPSAFLAIGGTILLSALKRISFGLRLVTIQFLTELSNYENFVGLMFFTLFKSKAIRKRTG